MDLEAGIDDLDSLNKNDFLPLLSQNIKQELFDTNNEENICDSPDKQVDDPAPPADSETPAEGEDSPMANKCVWCAQTLTLADGPKLLECLHVSCENCLKAKFSNATTVLCVACSMPNQMVGIIDNQFLVEQITLSEELAAAAASSANGADKDAPGAPTIKCSSCSDDAVATSWCVECAEYICDSCVQAHQRLKITKDHTIKSKEESTSGAASTTAGGAEKNIMCPVHAQEKLSLFCETCDRLTCRDCQLVQHRDHKYKFANEIATDTRATLNSLLGEISYKRVLLTSAMKVIDDRQAMITDKKKESVREIKNMVMRVTNGINMRSKILVMRLNEVCDSKLRVLHEKKLALQHLSGHTDHCIDFVQNALDKGSDSAVLFSKKALVKHLQQVKCQRADIPNPEIPVRIQVLLNGVNDILKDIAQMGTIVVDGKVYPPQLPSLTPHPGAGAGGGGGGGGGGIGGRSSTGASGLPNSGPAAVVGGGRQQQASPNMAPLIRLGGMIPPGIPNQGQPGQGGMHHQQQQSQQQSEPFQLYPGNPSPNPSFPSQSGMPGLSRQFSQDPTPPPPPSLVGQQQRFPPNLISRSGQAHGAGGPLVSSSTHPQNIDMNLRSLLNSQTGNNGPANMNQSQQQQMQRALQGPFGGAGGGVTSVNGANGPPPPPPPQNMRGHYGRIQGASPGTAFGSTSPANFMGQSGGGGGGVGGGAGNMNNQGPRFQGQCPPNCGPNMNMRGPMQQNHFANQQNNNNSGSSGNQSPFLNNNMGGFPPQGLPQQQHQQPPQQQQQQQQHQHPQIRMSMGSGAKWHIPQSLQQQQQMQMQQQNGMPGFMGGPQQQMGGMMQNNNNSSMSLGFMNGGGGMGGQMGSRTPDASFKINLKSPPTAMGLSMLPSMKQGPPNVIVINSAMTPNQNQTNVSSTIPKTPSPSVNDSTKDSDSIDKLCAESMNDLMVTIAKLDSNGVQVLPEGRTKTTSPLVHSSTDITIEDKNGQKDDPNEDWCAVCLDGGELMCCDKCPKVFHQNCHIPPISNLPDESETWQCLLCMAVNDIRGGGHEHHQGAGEKRPAPGEMSNREFKILQRILLEMYCQYDISLAFREPEPSTNDDFYNLISHPICLEDIKRNLDVNNPHHYRDVQSFVNDVRLIFKNSILYHEEMKLVSKIIDDARALEHFFEQLMGKWMPGYSSLESANDDRHKYPLKRPRKSIELD